MEIKIFNAGNITEAKLKVTRDELNLKYGLNGVGKTSIARAIHYTLTNQEKLKDLISYGKSVLASATIPNEFTNSLYFDKTYADSYILQEDILNNSYEIIIKTEKYNEKIKAVEEKLKNLQDFTNNEKINKFCLDIFKFENDAKFTKEDIPAKTTTLYKGIIKGNPVLKIDSKISGYTKLITGNENYLWSKWFVEGKNYLEKDAYECPFCLSKVPDNFNEIHSEIGSTFETKFLQANITAKATLAVLKNYVNDENERLVDKMLSGEEKVAIERIKKLNDIFTPLKLEKDKLNRIKKYNPQEMMDLGADNIKNSLLSAKLIPNIFSTFGSDIITIVKGINDRVDLLLEDLSDFQVSLGKLKTELNTSVKKAKDFINEFLKIAGIPYAVEVSGNSENDCRTFLKPNNTDLVISEPRNKLSFGEQNALSLILFAMEVNSKNVDLIILDDPVSSFDDTKKYAIMHHLFKSSETRNFYKKTVIFLTHDFTPVIDFIYKGKPNNESVNANYLSYRDGVIEETFIGKDDIKNMYTIERKNASNSSLGIISRLVHLRRSLELDDNLGLEYNMLSSLFHHKEKPTIKNSDRTEVLMDQNQIDSAQVEIKKFVSDFDYQTLINKISDSSILILEYNNASVYEKLSIARIYSNKFNTNVDKVLLKFLNETYHIENNNLLFISEEKYDLVPGYIQKLCDEIMVKVPNR